MFCFFFLNCDGLTFGYNQARKHSPWLLLRKRTSQPNQMLFRIGEHRKTRRGKKRLKKGAKNHGRNFITFSSNHQVWRTYPCIWRLTVVTNSNRGCTGSVFILLVYTVKLVRLLFHYTQGQRWVGERTQVGKHRKGFCFVLFCFSFQ